MARRRRPKKRTILPDPIYKSELVAKFVNNLMVKGKKSISEKIMYGAFDIIKERTGKEGFEVFKQAIENVKPQLEVKSRRVGGANYQVPIEVKPNRRLALAMRWLITFSRQRNEHTMMQRLANEFMAAANNEGASIKKKENTHRMAEANRAFAHYKW